ncbi:MULTISPECIES: hypothetical protein [Zhongshania]|uniref:hypothetical protein n=1 Tax=Zhongshania TaxID=1434050 RepID=UPI0002F97079|nr:hypothetical protein [Zhongshania aliphaticivorans]
MPDISDPEKHSTSSRTILSTSPHVDFITKNIDSVFTIKKNLVINTDEHKLVHYLYSSLTKYLCTFHGNSAISLKIEDQLDLYKRKFGQFYSEIIAFGPEHTIDDIFDFLVNALSYLTQRTLSETGIWDHQLELKLFSKEEVEFFDICISEFIEKHSGSKISKPFECHLGLSESSTIYFTGRIKKATLHQIDMTQIQAVIEIHGFDDNNKEIKGTIVEGDLEGKRIVLHTISHDTFIQAARGYIDHTKFSCLYKEKGNKLGGKVVNELLAFNAII